MKKWKANEEKGRKGNIGEAYGSTRSATKFHHRRSERETEEKLKESIKCKTALRKGEVCSSSKRKTEYQP